MLVMVVVVNMVVMLDRTGQDRQNWHLNLTFQVTWDWKLSQFLRCFTTVLSEKNLLVWIPWRLVLSNATFIIESVHYVIDCVEGSFTVSTWPEVGKIRFGSIGGVKRVLSDTPSLIVDFMFQTIETWFSYLSMETSPALEWIHLWNKGAKNKE